MAPLRLWEQVRCPGSYKGNSEFLAFLGGRKRSLCGHYKAQRTDTSGRVLLSGLLVDGRDLRLRAEGQN